MIVEKLQLQLAKEEGIKIEDSMVDKTLDEMAKRDGLSKQQMQEFVEGQGIPFPRFRETIKTEMTLSKIQQKEIAPRINITKSEIEHFMKSSAVQDQSDAEFHIGHILIAIPERATESEKAKLEQEAKSLVQNLRKGENFAQLAAAKTGSDNNGDLGWRKFENMPTLFIKPIRSLKRGDVYGPIVDNSGFHIIKLIDKRLPGGSKSLNSNTMRARATEMLFQKKYEEFMVSWLRKLRADAEVEIYLNGR